jgi:FixJ family two-component response regulator
MAMRCNIVAIVDDDLALRGAVETLLSSLGYRAELFASGEEFLEAATKSKAKCLVTDIQLGDISGIELGRQLAAAGHTIPIIFMTALDDERIHAQAMELGCVAYLRKPFSSDLLVAAIIQATNHQRATKQ